MSDVKHRRVRCGMTAGPIMTFLVGWVIFIQLCFSLGLRISSPSVVSISGIDPATLQGRVILVRVDFAFPLPSDEENSRLVAALPTIRFLMERKAKVVLLSDVPSTKGEEVAHRLTNLLDAKVECCPHPGTPDMIDAISKLHPGSVLLLENIGFHEGEALNDSMFAHKMANVADVFVQDSFIASHQVHASTGAVPVVLQKLDRPNVAGLALARELKSFDNRVIKNVRPFVAIIGGSNLSSKVDMLKRLLEKVDWMFIGGPIAATFLHAQGFSVGESHVEYDSVFKASELIDAFGSKLVFPADVVVAPSIDSKDNSKVVLTSQIPAGTQIFDIGPESVNIIGRAVAIAETVLWNGPLGQFEELSFAVGSISISRALAALGSRSKSAFIVVSEEAASVIGLAGLLSSFTHYIPTLEQATGMLLGVKALPGVEVLDHHQM